VASEPPAAAGVVPGEGASGRGHLAAGAAVAETTPALSRVPRSTVPRGAARRAPTQLSLHDAEAAGVAHRRDEVGAGQVRSHRRGDDGMFNSRHVAKIRFHVNTSRFQFSWFDGSDQADGIRRLSVPCDDSELSIVILSLVLGHS